MFVQGLLEWCSTNNRMAISTDSIVDMSILDLIESPNLSELVVILPLPRKPVRTDTGLIWMIAGSRLCSLLQRCES